MVKATITLFTNAGFDKEFTSKVTEDFQPTKDLEKTFKKAAKLLKKFDGHIQVDADEWYQEYILEDGQVKLDAVEGLDFDLTK